MRIRLLEAAVFVAVAFLLGASVFGSGLVEEALAGCGGSCR
jgi:hypothetical protein